MLIFLSSISFANLKDNAVELSHSENVDFRIVNIDHGVGKLKIKKNFKYNKMNSLKNENFNNFLEYKKNCL